jgi:O-antigen ligase
VFQEKNEMKNIFTIQDSIENRITYYHVALFLVFLPFDRFYSELVLISLLLHTLIHSDRPKWKRVFSRENLLLSAVFFITIVGMAWSSDRGQAMKDMQRQLAIVLVPFVLSATGIDLRRYLKNWLILFGITCAMTILCLYADAFGSIAQKGLPFRQIFTPAYINHDFAAPISMHATYLSMYAALSLGIFLHFSSIERDRNLRLLYITGILVLLAGLIQLASRSVLIAMTMYAVIAFPLFLSKGRRRSRWLIGIGGLALVGLLAITQIDAFQKRYMKSLQEDLSVATIGEDAPESRAARWKQALGLIRESPLIGYGSGSEKRLLKERYFENKLYTSFVKELNAHNQYLSFLLKTGIIGLAIFLFVLYRGVRTAWRSKDAVFTCFILLVAVVSFSENILDVNKGIFFYAFFFSLFGKTGKPFQRSPRLVKRTGVKEASRVTEASINV